MAGYQRLMDSLSAITGQQKLAVWRHLARTDLYFLLRFILSRPDLEHQWLLDRCREVEENPDGHLDLWPRGHYKSTIITYAKTIQDILASHGDDPLPEWGGIEITVGIFSHTRPIAKAFLRQIKYELQGNPVLLELFPEILWENSEREAPRWSEDSGLVVKRRSNPKEATLEAWGLIDGQPVGKHFNVLLYDDVVTLGSVSGPEMIGKTTQAWELSLNLGDRNPRKRVIGTRYHFADTYRTIMERGAAKPRIRKGTHDGTLTGDPVFLTPAEWNQKVKEMGPYAANSQLLLNPIADSKQSFQRVWLENRFTDASNWRSMNRALLCDPASSKKANSDYTAIAVMAYAPDGNVYLLDALRDRLSLQERAKAFIEMHRRWKPQHCGYERYGMQADIDYIKLLQEQDNYRFNIEELGGQMAKFDRINRLVPFAASGRLWMPDVLYRTLHDGRPVDLIQVLVEEELLPWPVPIHDDLADAMSRVFDLESLAWPRGADASEGPRRERYTAKKRTTWMSG